MDGSSPFSPSAVASRMVAQQPPLLQIVGLTKRYGEERVLDDVSFSVHSAEVLGLIGPNGAGKTTLLEAMAGLIPVDSGAVLWRGAALAPAHRH